MNKKYGDEDFDKFMKDDGDNNKQDRDECP
jgi:hypothetical protein